MNLRGLSPSLRKRAMSCWMRVGAGSPRMAVKTYQRNLGKDPLSISMEVCGCGVLIGCSYSGLGGVLGVKETPRYMVGTGGRLGRPRGL
jgi:hypothetical protein